MLKRRNRRLTLWYIIPAVLLVSFLNASAADARVEFRGGGTVYGFDGCEEFGWEGAETVVARFRPSGLPGNGANTFLTMFWNNFPYAMGLATRGGPFTSSFQEVDGAGIGGQARLLDNRGQGRRFSELRVTRQQPGTITAETENVRLEGVIRHFDGLRGCTARFEFLMRRR